MWVGMGEPAYDYYAIIWPSIIYDLTRPHTVREKYYLDRHKERYKRRYGKEEQLIKGEIGTFG